jgi:hypothetical protein
MKSINTSDKFRKEGEAFGEGFLAGYEKGRSTSGLLNKVQGNETMNKPFFLVVKAFSEETGEEWMCAMNIAHIVKIDEGTIPYKGNKESYVMINLIEGKTVFTFGTVLEILKMMQKGYNNEL